MKTNIYLANAVQKTLFELELKGQLSDGYWENARPHDHWKAPCAAEVHVVSAGERPHVDFTPARNYQFNSPELIKIVGDRMLKFARARLKYPEISNEAISLIEHAEYDYIWEDKHRPNYQAVIDELGVKNKEDLCWLNVQLDSVNYKLSDLRSDLKAIKDAFNVVIYKPFSPVGS